MNLHHRSMLGLVAAGLVFAVTASSWGDAALVALRSGGPPQTRQAGVSSPAGQTSGAGDITDAPIAPRTTNRPGKPTAAGAAVQVTAPASITYLMRQYGVSEAEAQRRVALQLASTELEQQLASRFPDEYAGMWLDQAAGVLRVGMTKPERLATAAPELTGADQIKAGRIKAVPMSRSLRRLRQEAAAVAEALGDTPGVEVTVDQPGNTVRLLSSEQAGSGGELAEAIAASGSKGVQVQQVEPERFVLKACDPRYCDQAPLRSGIRLDIPRDDGTVGGCTTGFRLRSMATGREYLLTAGHCVLGGRHTRVDDTFHLYKTKKVKVSIEDPDQSLLENDYTIGRDYAIMRYQPGAEDVWLPAAYPPAPRALPKRPPGLLNYWCPGGCTGSHDILIGGYRPLSTVKVGWVVCATGSGYTPGTGESYVDSGAGAGYVPGTRCGEITDVDSRIWVRICARPGDSGGPLFTEADGMALGILSGGDPGSGACDNPSEINFYAPISTILSRANARTGGALRLTLVSTSRVFDTKRGFAFTPLP